MAGRTLSGKAKSRQGDGHLSFSLCLVPGLQERGGA